ncbi:MAG: DNA topoisomerase VI subunit B [Phycisphaerae bacterium]|nr:DNA topoisomerase VI subunit B [Phycisphaerae bacterium]
MSPSPVLELPLPKDGTTPKKSPPRATAESMAAKQRDISVSEFFAKNRHLLGFDNPRKALLTTVKEAVDNSLDACEEAGILPEIVVVIEDLEDAKSRNSEPAKKGEDDSADAGKKPKAAKASRYRVTVVDNGPGIVRKQVENIFGRLLYGSKFHRLKMSRGQQGIGISAAGMYGLITTGKPMMIQTRPDARNAAHHIELAMNTKTNRAEVTADDETDDFPLARLRDLNPAVRELAERGEFLSPASFPTGTSVTIELEGKYQKGRGSVDEFLELTAIANPHAKVVLVRPTRTIEEEDDTPLLKKGKPVTADAASKDGEPESLAGAPGSSKAAPAVTEDLGPLVVFPRAVGELPPETKEIQPHPKGIELGILLQMLKDYEAAEKGGTLYAFLQEKFCRISPSTASEFCSKIKVTSRTKAADIEPPQAEKLYKEFQDSKLAPPPTDCLAPIGVQQLLKGMFKGVRAEFYAASSREPDIYRGRPFLIEAAIAFGGELPADDSARVIRFANRVPLLFQQSACSSFKAVTETNWRNYDLQHPRNSLPVGPLVIMIHMASVWVPFTSESKEAIADYDEIRKEMKLALMECGRKLGIYLRKRAKMKREGERRDVFQKYIGEIAKACNAITGADAKKLYDALLQQAKSKTAIADVELDEEGKAVKDDPSDQDGVIIVDAPTPDGSGREAGAPPALELTDLPKPRGKPSSDSRKPASEAKRGKASRDADAPPLEFSKAEAAALMVASLRDDDSPRGGREESKSGAKPLAKPTGKREPQPKSKPEKGLAGKPVAGPSSKQSPEKRAPNDDAKTARLVAKVTKAPEGSAAKPSKPKVRLVNGKLVPVDDGPSLF